ncbi:unnamed protein product [Effrenium voratum]|nr:unnamed protein product [Effrenium voratum]
MLSRLWGMITGKRPAEEGGEPPAKRRAGSPRSTSSASRGNTPGQAASSKPQHFYIGGPEFKLLLLGDGQTGKTCFVQRHLSGEFPQVYRPTEGCEMRKLKVFTSQGPVLFNIWDTAGQEQFSGLRDGYFIGSQCAMVFFDVTKRESHQNVARWVSEVRKVTGDIPIVVVGNKIDLARIVKAQEGSLLMRKLKVQYYDLSVKTRFNLEMPLLCLARRLLHDNSLKLVAEEGQLPRTPSAPSSRQRRQAELDLARATNVPIEDDDDDL